MTAVASIPNTAAFVAGVAIAIYLACFWLACRASANADEDALLHQAQAAEVRFEDQEIWDWPVVASDERTAAGVRLMLGRVDQRNIEGPLL